MKEYYTVSEISRLYGIGIDSLRYYEKIGALSPRRGENNYRLYSLKDIYRLNVIRDLLMLGFSMKQIGEYLDCQNMESTLSMLEEEKKKVRQQRERLKRIERAIEERVAHLEKYEKIEVGSYQCLRCQARYCLQVHADIPRDEEMDYAVKRLQKRHEDKIRSLGEREIGASVSPQDVKNGIYNLFHSVFIILDELPEDGERDGLLVLPEGEYLTVYYRGSYRQSPQRILELMEEAERRGLKIEGDILEWYPVDNRYTVEPQEFVTRLQARVVPGKE